jgi:hypothetical protein
MAFYLGGWVNDEGVARRRMKDQDIDQRHAAYHVAGCQTLIVASGGAMARPSYMHRGRHEECAMKYPKHVMAIKPGYRWESGRHHVGFLRLQTDLSLPGSPDHDKKEFAALLTWAEAYRDRRYPNHIVEWKALNP